MKKSLALLAVSAALLVSLQEAEAHIHYLDTQSPNAFNSQTVNSDGSTTFHTLGTVRGNGAWANAADSDWGDTHSIPWYRFDVTHPGGAYIDLTVAGGITEMPSGLTVLGDLTPAVSLYKGLLPNGGHDAATPLPDKEGVWNALGDTTAGNGPSDVYDYSGVAEDPETGETIGEPIFLYYDPGEVRTIQYITHAGLVDGADTGVSLFNVFLEPGSYTLTLGGTCYECFPHYSRLDPGNPTYDPTYENIINDIENDNRSSRGFKLDLTVQPVPLPGAVWLLGSALTGLIGVMRRRRSTV